MYTVGTISNGDKNTAINICTAEMNGKGGKQQDVT